jgi:folylpolyglutamate synthase/dihydropteroate synthase
MQKNEVQESSITKGDTVIPVSFETPIDMNWIQCIPPTDLENLIMNEFKHVKLEKNDLIPAILEAKNSKRFHVICGSLYLVAEVYKMIKSKTISF